MHCKNLLVPLCLLLGLMIGCQRDGQVATRLPVGNGGAVGEPLRVMSFNIRYPNPADGLDYWPVRAGRVAAAIQAFGPDVLGVQEAYGYQVDFLAFHMAGYERVHAGREDGGPRGETTGILFRSERFVMREHGHFWLSETPGVIGSVGWDAALPRMATWVVLDDRGTGKRWIVLNTHFDHRGRAARVESARLIRQRVGAWREQYPDAGLLILGDFNADADSPVYQALGVGDPAARLIDTYRADPANADQPAGTFNGFLGTTHSARIDWIIASDNVQVLEAGIDRNTYNGRYPSDHNPVTAVVR